MDTFPALMQKITTAWGDKVAINDRDRETSYADLQHRSLCLAEGLKNHGVVAGDRVGVWLPNCTAYLETFLACAQIGAIVISLNTKFRSTEIADIVSRSKCKVLVLWPDFKNIPFLDILGQVPADSLSSVDLLVSYSETDERPTLPNIIGEKPWITFDALLAHRELTKSTVKPESPLVVFTTSGTTGKPKFVLHTHSSVTKHAAEVATDFGYTNRVCRLLQVNPLCGTFGLTQALAGFAGAGTIYCLPVFDADDAVQIMQSHAITDIHGSDDMFAMLLNAAEGHNPFPALEYAGFAAFNSAHADLFTSAHERNVKLIGLWGMSEVQAFVAHQRPSESAEIRKQAGGHLLSPSAKIRITDPENGKILPFGEMGELEISCPSQMTEYLDNPQATKETITGDGYIKTGDLAIQLNERRFNFLARMGDTLRLGGYLTDPVEIENCLANYTGVEKAQVVGVDTAAGTKAFAFIIPKIGVQLSEEGLTAFCKQNLAGYKIPVAYRFITDFPVTQSANGVKIQRSKLRDEASDQWKQSFDEKNELN